jgi:hypothetical protein
MATMLHDPKKIGRGALGSLKERVEHALEIARSKMGPVSSARPVRIRYEHDEGLHDSAAEHEPHERAVSKRDEGDSTGAQPYNLARAVSTVVLLARAAKTARGYLDKVRKTDPEHGIPWLHLLQKPRSPLSTVALLAAGAVAGVGAALLLTPETGAQMRARLARQLDIVRQRTIRTLDKALDDLARSSRGAPVPPHVD